MPQRPRITAILPCNDLDSAVRFFVRLGFTAPTEKEATQWDSYIMLSHPNGSDIHLTKAVEGWLEAGKNPFGLYVYTEDVDALGREFADEIIEKGKKPELKEWGMYEFSLNGPDETLVRVGWPGDEMEKAKSKAPEKSE
ncbi:hypothetical protein GQ53DRAFT_835640 [Thozetella sp. PMI_491]|nr:hypothetical protein GQ53DRAFT_835640 [Thozetella sp. PMI_491]